MDLSKGFSVVPRSHAPIRDLAKKPEWYHRRPASPHVHAACRSRAALRPDDGAGAEPGSYANATLGPGLYRDGVHGDLWCSGFYGPGDGDSSGEEDSDSSSDVIVLVSTSKQPLLCSSFVADGVRRTLEPLSPARGCCRRTELPSSPSPDSSSSSESSDSSADIPPHHARPVVLLSDLCAAYADSAYSRADISSNDSDVVEVPVTPVTPPRQKTRLCRQRSLGNDERVQSSPTQLKRRKRPALPRPPRHRLTRSVKKDAVGIYYESCDSDSVMTYALCSSGSDDARPPPPSQAEAEPRPEHQRPLATRRRKQAEGRRRAHKASRTKTAVTRRGRSRPAAPSLFPPPEALFKVRQSKRKRTTTSDIFHPFVRMRRHLCTVVNQQEDALTQDARQKKASVSSSGFVPKTSCFHLARHAAADPATPLCCLCGHVTNAQGLGDLHGPYYLDHAPSPSCDQGERWIHADCGVWSAGVFLVGGKLYGLEEAASVTRRTVCSACQRSGAIMGCSQKGCTRSYHYTCARHSGCILNEDNLSMRCGLHHMTRHQRHQQS
uniref:retinoic acid-induced protein 1-like isoform X2 n=1 Tax=Doryrhamphus excisus TaxID=161450 RepID=UPI0025ADB8C7|nr:retinoic acid-induced protein 1-like isoform X2 [Doryrhamphus excisus]